jgi:hypothetical protein
MIGLVAALVLGGALFCAWKMGVDYGIRIGRLRERESAVAWVLGAHRVAEPLTPKRIASCLKDGEHETWGFR